MRELLAIGLLMLSACAHRVKPIECEQQLQPINLSLSVPALSPPSNPEDGLAEKPKETQP